MIGIRNKKFSIRGRVWISSYI